MGTCQRSEIEICISIVDQGNKIRGSTFINIIDFLKFYYISKKALN
jgi:hypothetical protein